MKSPVALILLFSLALYTSNTYARKDPGEYWRAVMNEPMPEEIKHLMPRHSVPLSKDKTDCYTSSSIGGEAFEPKTDLSVYHDDAKLKEADKSLFTKDFEPRPSATGYHDDDAGLKQEKSFAEYFEPKTNMSVYDDANLKEAENLLFTKDFEPRPGATGYHDDDDGLKQEKSFAEDFEPRPNISVYQD
ncbi:organ-specific protein s2 [Nicotiana attenuata]|uniref:Organ-specific protein s2 n=2 Tax=Nicotiana attenuata TaxID=49451 RepID=A0A1J6K2B4_NICAT|nr:organ-specific protein s2 [Nicotiana attenuata]